MELVVISGKGGTGKTTISAALSELARDVVSADCDVDAPNLYLLFGGKDIESQEFFSGKKAIIDNSLCDGCKICESYCKFEAIKAGKIIDFRCEGCGACTLVCPKKAISLIKEKTASICITQTDSCSCKRIISRAEMDVGTEGSGKLVTEVRKNAKKYKEDKIIIIDGSPGIGCAVMASLTGSDACLIVTEPTMSGLEDFLRVLAVCEHFDIRPFVCINKYDLNLDMSEEIEKFCEEKNISVAGKIPFDEVVMRAINSRKPITYYSESSSCIAISNMWSNIKNKLKI